MKNLKLIVVEFRKVEDFEFKSAKKAAEFEKNPRMSFEFNPDHADDGNETLHILKHESIPLIIPNDSVSVERSGKVCTVKVAVRFAVYISNSACDQDFNEWSTEQGGWATAEINLIGFECDYLDNGESYLGTEDLYGYKLEPLNDLEFATLAERSDKDFVLSAVKLKSSSLAYASESLRNDRDVVLAAVALDGLSLKYASEMQRGDRDIVLVAVSNDGNALQYAAELYKSNKDIVLVAVNSSGTAIQWCSQELRNDLEVVSAAVHNDVDALEHVDAHLAREFFGNKNVVIAKVSMPSWSDGYWSLADVPENLRNDTDVIRASVKENPSEIEFVSIELKNNREFVIQAVDANGLVLFNLPKKFSNDKRVVLTALENANVFEYLSDEMRFDYDVVLAAVKNHGDSLEFTSCDMKNNKEVVLVALSQNGQALKHASSTLKNDKDVVLAAVRQDGRSLEYAGAKFKSNKQVVLMAVRQNGWALEFASDKLRADKEVIEAAVEDCSNAIEFALL